MRQSRHVLRSDKYRVPVDKLKHIPCLKILPVLQENLTSNQTCAWDIWYGFTESILYQSKSDDRFYLNMDFGYATTTTVYDTFDAAVDAIPSQIDELVSLVYVQKE